MFIYSLPQSNNTIYDAAMKSVLLIGVGTEVHRRGSLCSKHVVMLKLNYFASKHFFRTYYNYKINSREGRRIEGNFGAKTGESKFWGGIK